MKMEIYLKNYYLKLLIEVQRDGYNSWFFCRKNLETMNEENLKLFEEMLEIPDPDLYKWFTSEEVSIPEKYTALVKILK